MAKRIIAPEVLTEGRRLYEQTLAPVRDIAAMMGVSVTYFYTMSHRHGWRQRKAQDGAGHFSRALSRTGAAALIAGRPEDALRAPPEPPPPPATAEQRLVLAQRLQEAVGEQIDAIKRVAQLVGDPGQADLGARAAAALSRTLRETHELLQPPPALAEKKTGDDDEPFPYDVEQFRSELARALRAVLDERRGRAPRGSDEPDREAASLPPSREAEN
jgi:hypothetical protein